MSLKEYAQKRDFEKTPEPKGSERPKSKPAGRSFYVQRHDATRLHYDLRLEIGGTLKSWAVPKGPSLDPAKKNLAMMVEDHPIEYGTFEGNIPKGNYGAGSVMLWDQGRLEILEDKSPEAQLERGDLKFRLEGQKLRGSFAIVRMKNRGKGNEWLLIKKRDGEEVEGWDVEEHAWSVKTGRSQDEIASDLPAKKPRKTAAKGAPKTRARKPASKSDAADEVDPAAIPGAVKSPMPANVGPMMAHLAAQVPSGPNWIYEVKWDGVRALCYLENGKFRMVSRNGNSFDRQYPELSVVPHYIKAETAILDGEIAVLDEKGRSSFGLIQPRIHQTDPNSIAHLVRNTPVKLFAFDLLYLNGYDLRQSPLAERKRALKAILAPADRLQYSEHFEARGEEMLDAARAMGLEGLVAKDATSKYESRRSKSWLKIKVVGHQDFVICGFTHGERDTFSSLVLGVYEKGELVWVGNAGTGFNEKSLRVLHDKLMPLVVEKSPFKKKPAMLRQVTWVRPELVCEVKFGEWTRDGKLRAPVFIGLRTDKKPEECVREVPLTDVPQEEAAPSSGGPLISPGVNQQNVKAGSITLKLTNLDKVLYPSDGYTKRDVLNYYDAVADLLVPHLKDRPLSLKRYPNGIDKDFFFQKDMPEHLPSWIRVEPIHSEHRGAPIRYAIADNRETLLYLANLGCIDQNPWMSRIGSLDCPDYVLIDLDPQECSYEKIIEAAQLVKRKLDELQVEGYPKTTGGDGLHVYIPVVPEYTYEHVRSFAEILSQLVINEEPDLFTTPRAVAKRRKGRVYFDYLQISSGKTIAAPYVLRAYEGAPVSTPLSWEEVKPGLLPKQFNIENALDRFRRTGDLFEPVLNKPQRLEPVIQRLTNLMKNIA